MFTEELEHMTWYERVEIELNQLKTRLDKLEPLILYPTEEQFKSIGSEQFGLLQLQYQIMVQYKEVLEQRLSLRG